VARRREKRVAVATNRVVVLEADHHDRAAVAVTALAEHGDAGNEAHPLRLVGDPVVRLPSVHQ